MATSLPISIRSGLSLGPDACRIIAQIDELIDAGEIDSEIYRWEREAGWSARSVEWVAIRAAPGTRSGVFFTLGLGGQIDVEDNGTHAGEYIDRLPNGRRDFGGDLRDIRLIGKELFVAGMGRQVYRRIADGEWAHEDEGTRQLDGDLSVAGFNAIDGTDPDGIYAAGFGGEIWHRRGGRWHQVESPTNLVLHRLRVVAPDLVYACGQQGVLLRGHGDIWTVVEHGQPAENFWGMEWFDGKLYLADNRKLFLLTGPDELTPVDPGFGPFGFGDLHAAGGALWSFGAKRVAMTTDGTRWHNMTPGAGGRTSAPERDQRP